MNLIKNSAFKLKFVMLLEMAVAAGKKLGKN